MAAALSLETLFTHPRGFDVGTASNAQRAMCRIADGLPLGELANDPTVVKVVGGPEALEMLAALPRRPPLELYVLAAIRTGKSLFTAALAVHTALTIDLTGIRKSDVPRVAVVSLDKDKAKIVMDHAMAALERDGSFLKRYLMKRPKPTNEKFFLRRDDGRKVEVVISAGRRGGANLVSRWTVACIFDEAARMLGQEDGVVNLDDMRSAVIERLRLLRSLGAMARLVAVSSPWAARGPIFDAVEEFWGKPSSNLVIFRATGPELCPYLWTPEAVEAARLDPRGSYENDVLGLFVDPENGWLNAAELRNATRIAPLERARDKSILGGVSYTAAMDPATSGNAWTLVIVAKHEGSGLGKERYSIDLVRQWQGTPAAPLKARDVFAEMGPILKTYGLTSVFSDRWGGSLMAEIGDYGGVQVDISRDSQEQTAQNFADFRTLMLDGRLEIAPDRQLAADLLSFRKKLQPGGAVRYEAPVTKDGRHADKGQAAVLAVARASRDVDWVVAMNAARAKGGSLLG